MPKNEEPCPHKIVVDIDTEKPQSYDVEDNARSYDSINKELIEDIKVRVVKEFLKVNE